MEPLNFERWWPDDFGHPSASGGQNDTRYAFFPETHRLLIDRNGHRTTFDTSDHLITGVSSQQGGGGEPSLVFSSQHGPVRLQDLRVMDEPSRGGDGETIHRGDVRARSTTPHSPDSAMGGRPAPPPPEARQVEQAESTAPQPDPAAGERVVFSEEGAARNAIKLVVRGDIDLDMIEALEDFLRRSKRRLGRG